MLKEYLKENNISIYRLAKDAGVPYSTLNDLVNDKVDVDTCKFGMIRKLACALEMSIEQFYDLTKIDMHQWCETYGVDVTVLVKRKKYYAEYDYEGKTYLVEVCPVNKDTTYRIEDFSKWSVEEDIVKREREKK